MAKKETNYGSQLTWVRSSLRDLRIAQGLSLAQAGEGLGWSKIQMHQIENSGIRDLQLTTILRVLDFYGVKPNRFFKSMPDFDE